MVFWVDLGKMWFGWINYGEGGCGFYFDDLNGYCFEVLICCYGSGG